MIEGLYLVTDSDHDGRLTERVKAALQGGARVVQYRDKGEGADRLETARTLRALCSKAGATFIINDDAALAKACDADGVHLGQSDGAVAEARAILGEKKIVGRSTRTVELALAAVAEGADYIGVGAVYPTSTKGDACHIGLEGLKKIRAAVEIPVVAIGGIDRDGAAAAIDAGADSVALVSAVMADPAPAVAAREIALLFNRRLPLPRGRVLTVAGSDSGGGAGVQADLKTATLLGSYGASAITALTAQNTLGVSDIHPAPVDFVAAQIEAVLSDIGADVLKTGMLYSAGIVEKVAEAIERNNILAVVDPVMIAKGGASLLQRQAVEAFVADMIGHSYLLTPNLPEAEALTGIKVETEANMEEAARRLQKMGARNVLLKGGHLEGEAVDLLLEGENLHRFESQRFDTANTHGTGCTFSAAIAAFLAQGLPLVEAVREAKAYIGEAIKTSRDLGSGHGPVNHWTAAVSCQRSAFSKGNP